MFFQSMNQMMNPNVDITLVIRKSADGRMAVSVLPKSNTLKDEAQNSIVPLTLNGTPEELDTGFMQVVGRPMQKASGLISNMAQFEAQADKAASSSKSAKEAKAKESKEEREKREKYEKNLKKAEEHIAAKKHKEAVDALTEARKNGSYPHNGQPRYSQQPMPFEHDMAAHAPRMADPDDAPPYRPEEYAEYPDFPASMLQGNYAQPQMM